LSSSNIQDSPITDKLFSDTEKAISLFKFIGELDKMKQRIITNYSEYNWHCSLNSIHEDPENIEIFYRDRVEDESTEYDSALLRVHKPEFQKCPAPDPTLLEWIEGDWTSFRDEISRLDTIERKAAVKDLTAPEGTVKIQPSLIDSLSDHLAFSNDRTTIIERFDDDELRVHSYDKWIAFRDAWVERQIIIDQTRSLFTSLYKLHIDLERESETLEMIIANGILRDRENNNINHPVLTRRVKTRFDAVSNTISIEDADVESELYERLFSELTDVDSHSIAHLRDDLNKNAFHPFDRNDTSVFFEMLVHHLSPESIFSKEGEPIDWKQSNRLLLYLDPLLILRKRITGTLKSIEQIIKNITETQHIPLHLEDIISGGKIEISDLVHEETVDEQLAAVGGESIDILLSKQANKEQLEIAQRIDQFNAVLVQGPPGTGKTHTIANLMGHYLAQGKSVLVTSHTKKALTVLKEQVVTGIQSLCVSVLDDSNLDMEKSIDGITDYMSKNTAYQLKIQIDKVRKERQQIISDLATKRKKLYSIINTECNSIILNGEEISPSKAACFVFEHEDDLSYIPGKVALYTPLPLSLKDLFILYQTNDDISKQDEPELTCGLPSPDSILSVEKYKKAWDRIRDINNYINEIQKQMNWTIQIDFDSSNILFKTNPGHFCLPTLNTKAIESLKNLMRDLGTIEPWMIFAAADSKKGSSFKQRWTKLIDQINSTCECAELVVSESFGCAVKFLDIEKARELSITFEKMKSLFSKKKKLARMDFMLNSNFDTAIEVVLINGNRIQSAKDCELVLHAIELHNSRTQCAQYWHDLFVVHNVKSFYELHDSEPEIVARGWIPLIKRYINWFESEYDQFLGLLRELNIPIESIMQSNSRDSELEFTEKVFNVINTTIPTILDLYNNARILIENKHIIDETIAILQHGKRRHSQICRDLLYAINKGDSRAYSEAYKQLEIMYDKFTLMQNRKDMLQKIAAVAPQWAESIENREGVHGEATVPKNVEAAWKWKQFDGIIKELSLEPFEKLQAESIALSKEYRKITAKYTEKCAWYHLLSRTERDIDMKQALQGWKLTVKRIGKGTGKNAPMYKAEARRLMAKCQTAVPGWIMPINKALESLDPANNQFDIVIIDEASQSDLSAMAIAYMAKKLIVVGDDKQVSPIAVGVEVEKVNTLVNMYIKGKIPNSHLYSAKTSLYEIASTTFQPLMLREHFRCVPEIIGFSNGLSYDYKIKPLRDPSSSILLPAVVNYRVVDGTRDKDVNLQEAVSIVALIKACLEQPEYCDKTFGVMSLLGEEQAKKIQGLIFDQIDPVVIETRKILCGIPSNFQGDARDVIFLSLVDSRTGNGPLSNQGFGADDSIRKRYNVAASRARDQLWVVDSLDSANDLKPGDLRKRLIDYSLNPAAFENIISEIEIKSESPFEASVAKSLVSRGFHLVQQWKVGSYRLDMVAVCGQKRVAIECDGERYHNDEAKIRDDMERQTILERLGWQFIRIRGSEYYRNPDRTIERICSELEQKGIIPENCSAVESVSDSSRSTELLERIKARASDLINIYTSSLLPGFDNATVAFALGTDYTDRLKKANHDIHGHQRECDPEETTKRVKRSAATISSKKTSDVSNEKSFLNGKWTSEKSHTSNKGTRSVGTNAEQLMLNIDPQDESKLQKSNATKEKRKTTNFSKKLALSTKVNPAGDDIISKLHEMGLEIIDNRLQSKIVWVIYSVDKKVAVEEFLVSSKCNFGLEKRGAISTNNRTAWRINI